MFEPVQDGKGPETRSTMENFFSENGKNPILGSSSAKTTLLASQHSEGRRQSSARVSREPGTVCYPAAPRAPRAARGPRGGTRAVRQGGPARWRRAPSNCRRGARGKRRGRSWSGAGGAGLYLRLFCFEHTRFLRVERAVQGGVVWNISCRCRLEE